MTNTKQAYITEVLSRLNDGNCFSDSLFEATIDLPDNVTNDEYAAWSEEAAAQYETTSSKPLFDPDNGRSYLPH